MYSCNLFFPNLPFASFSFSNTYIIPTQYLPCYIPPPRTCNMPKKYIHGTVKTWPLSFTLASQSFTKHNFPPSEWEGIVFFFFGTKAYLHSRSRKGNDKVKNIGAKGKQEKKTLQQSSCTDCSYNHGQWARLMLLPLKCTDFCKKLCSTLMKTLKYKFCKQIGRRLLCVSIFCWSQSGDRP